MSTGHDVIVAVALARSAVQAPLVANPFLAPKPRPLVVGHRGVQALHQENTLAGFRRAVAFGLDAIELDVRLTRDRRAVVFHDASAARLTGVRRAIADLSWDEVSRLRVRAAVGTRGGWIRYAREERVSLLAEVLAEVGHAIAINIELKPRWLGDELAAVVAADVAAAGVGGRVLVSSFDPRKLREARRADPSLAIGYSWDHRLFGGVVNRLIAGPASVHAVGVELGMVHDPVVRRLRAAGVAVGAHVAFPLGHRPTAAADLARVVAVEVDWIETDDPVRLRALLDDPSRAVGAIG